ncbi:MAG TPA: farnesyl diphosphate synthase [Lacipirellulaceae bacterium]|nr:farnesyl diphosphate synthase [Lacipirellulaceae bacterium]
MPSPPAADDPLQATPHRELIEAALRRAAEFDEGCPSQLAEAIRYSLLAPGKRLRPQLVLLACQACGGSVESALPAAVAVEMVHAYSLVHDDLPAMDNDDLRRGRPTCHRQFDEATAILTGDALLARAFEVLASEMSPPARAAACCAELARAAGAGALVGGQADDLAAEFRRIGLERLQSIHRRKTGALFRASLQLGAIAADASAEDRACLAAYGDHLGHAFQIVDDLLDVSGQEARVGKRLGKDRDHGKVTYPALLGVEESRARAARLIAQAIAAVAHLADRGKPLCELAEFVGRRSL